jgi:putative membrane protein
MPNRPTILLGAAVAAAAAQPALVQPALAQTSAQPGYWHMGWGWGNMMFGGLTMLLFWGGLIVLIFLAVRWFGVRSHPHDGGPPSTQTPLEILEERFARGEIEQEEFEARRRVLRGKG